MSSSSGSSGGSGATSRGRGHRGRRGQIAQVEQGGDILAPGGPPPVEEERPTDVVPRRSPERRGEDDDLVKKMASLEITRVCDRPNTGKLGRPIQLNANYFSIEIGGGKGSQLIVHRYQVEVKHPARDKVDKDDSRILFWELVDKNPEIFKKDQIVYDDSRTAYALEQLKLPGGGVTHTFHIKKELIFDNREQTYQIDFQYTGSHLIDLSQAFAPEHRDRVMTAIQVVDMVITQGIRCPIWRGSKGWYPFARSIYRMPQQGSRVVDLGGGREMWPGFTSAAKVGEDWKPILNVDVSNTAFVKPVPLLEYMVEILNSQYGGGLGGGGRGGRGGRGGGRGGNGRGGGDAPMFSVQQLGPDTELQPDWIDMLSKNFKALKLKTIHLQTNRASKFRAFEKPARDLIFKLSDGQEISVANYMAQKYKPLQYPGLPCVHSGSKQKKTYYPMELLEVYSPQKVTKKLTDQQTATMIRQSARPAFERKQLIEGLIKDAALGASDPFMNAFQMSMGLQMIGLNGRVLNGQQVVYNQFCGNLLNACDSLGMQFPTQWPDCVEYCGRPQELQQQLKLCLKQTQAQYQRDCQLIIVLLRTRDSFAYSEVKRWGEIELGVMTQVILLKNAAKIAEDRGATGATAVNVAMKLNMKLGGINNGLLADQVWSRFAGEQNATLFLGVDVTHPGAGDRRSPSIGAVVGNVDFEATKYGASIKVQPHRQEHILYLHDTVKERILQYYQLTKKQPERIVVYRDGVSEGEFLKVLNEEMKSVRSACEKLSETYRPPITYIVVQKRHHTRLFCRNAQEAVGRAQNIPPGTVVDTAITHPCEFDFYLCSHFGIQGTSRPTHYFVLHDENNFNADELQMVTYQLCHLYGRCTRVVSIPAPVYFADLCATRARYHVRSKLGILESGSSTERHEGGDGEDSSASENQLTEAVTIHEELQNRMYFS